MKAVRIERFSDGLLIQADCTQQETLDIVRKELGGDFCFRLIVTDPPYGRIVSDQWDQWDGTDASFAAWMRDWTKLWCEMLAEGGSFYVWGGIGKPGFRPFFSYIQGIEEPGVFELANLITWKKRRGYGRDNNYLFTREELAWFVKGEASKPLQFNIPLLDEKRGYAGYNKKYPAKSEYYRRTNVWTDIGELMRGKLHKAQKPERVIEIPIETHTCKDDWVLDIFAGSGTTGSAARKLGRRFVLIEKNPASFEICLDRLR